MGGSRINRCEAHRHPIFSAAILPDACSLILAGRDCLLRIWNTEEQRENHRFEGHTDAVYSVVVSPDGRFALSGSGDRTVRLWKLSEGSG